MWGIKVVLCGLMLAYSNSSFALIFGKDERQPLSIEDAEKIGLKPIVYLVIKKPHGIATCTGTWISKTHILTARHCVALAEKILVINQFENYLGRSRALGKRVYVDRSSSDNQKEWYGSFGLNDKEGRPNQGDWAVIEVDEEAGNDPETVIRNGSEVNNYEKYKDGSAMGTLKIGYSKSLNENPGITAAAYHNDRDNTIYRQNCSYRPRNLMAHYMLMFNIGLFELDCDMIEGASGSPILSCNDKGCTIVGIYSGEIYSSKPEHEGKFSYRNANMAVRSENFVWSVNRLLKGDHMYVKSAGLQIPKCKRMACLN